MDPLWAAILGGAVGGVIVAIVESVLGRSREHERWLRDHRQRVYADFLGSAHRALDVQSDISFRAENLKPDEPVAAKGAELMELFSELTAAARRMDVIASAAMRQRSLSMLVQFAAFGNAVEEYITGSAKARGEDPIAGLAAWQVQNYQVTEFAEAARRELGAGRDIRHRLRRRVRLRAEAIRAWWRKRRTNRA